MPPDPRRPRERPRPPPAPADLRRRTRRSDQCPARGGPPRARPCGGGTRVSTEPADVLIIGAGASGGVVGLRLAEAGFKVVCLEQGEWLDRAEYPGNKLDWELKARKDWATSPNIRGLAQD